MSCCRVMGMRPHVLSGTLVEQTTYQSRRCYTPEDYNTVIPSPWTALYFLEDGVFSNFEFPHGLNVYK
jgi:hypothetical protein